MRTKNATGHHFWSKIIKFQLVIFLVIFLTGCATTGMEEEAAPADKEAKPEAAATPAAETRTEAAAESPTPATAAAKER